MITDNKFSTPNPKKLKKSASTSSDSGKDPIHVYCRLRPLKEGTTPTSSLKLVSSDTLALITPSDAKGVSREIHYKFEHVFTAESSQKDVFDLVAYPLLEDLLKGINGLLFSYGVTGSGKTYTLNGNTEDPGILPRCLNTIFNSIGHLQAPKFLIKPDKMNGFEIQSENDAVEERMQAIRSAQRTPKSTRKLPNRDAVQFVNDGTRIFPVNENNLYSVFVSYVEIYNNTAFDLLDENLQRKLLREDSQKAMYVSGVNEVEVKSSEEAFEVFRMGLNRKRMGATVLNTESSRSHSIFNIRVVQLERDSRKDGQPLIPDRNLVTVGQLSLVDLAGSERTNRTQNVGDRLKEASSINNSLMTLRNCLEILRENQLKKTNRPVPYRDSRLTLLFKNYFEGGEGTVQMIVCVNPSQEDLEENMHVLKFAEMTQDVKIIKAEPKLTPYRPVLPSKVFKATPSKSAKKTTNGCNGFSLLPEIPLFTFDPDNDIEAYGEIMNKVMKILKVRKDLGKPVNKDCREKKKEFRKKLAEVNQENVMSKTEIRSLKTLLHKEKQKSQNTQTKLNNKETEIVGLKSTIDELHNVIRSQQHTINEKDLKLNRNILEKEKTKQRLAQDKEKMTQELDAKLKKQRDHLNAAMRAKENKLMKVRQVLDSEMPPIDLTAILPDHPTEVPKTPKSALKESRRNVAVASTPTSCSRRRRSRSLGEVWLEHNVIKPVPLGTVMQPSIKKRKSVSKLEKASDITHPKQSKYCLVTQDQDTDGEVETRLYKADIVPTCGGGAQVVFNDIEKLRQESPS